MRTKKQTHGPSVRQVLSGNAKRTHVRTSTLSDGTGDELTLDTLPILFEGADDAGSWGESTATQPLVCEPESEVWATAQAAATRADMVANTVRKCIDGTYYYRDLRADESAPWATSDPTGAGGSYGTVKYDGLELVRVQVPECAPPGTAVLVSMPAGFVGVPVKLQMTVPAGVAAGALLDWNVPLPWARAEAAKQDLQAREYWQLAFKKQAADREALRRDLDAKAPTRAAKRRQLVDLTACVA